MPRAKFELKRKENGKYDLSGLSERQFSQAMRIIEQQKAKVRRAAKNTISPRLLRSKNEKELNKLTNKPDGTPYTGADLIELEKNRKKHEKKYGKQKKGIPHSAIFANSLEIDIKRANNQVDDGSGIRQANMNAVKDNTVFFRVKASEKHKADYHQVKLRFEDWESRMHNADPTTKGYRTATKKAVKGDISFDCNCERHQFWYRYLATIGNYSVSPPKEFSPPKERNPSYVGIACKHVLHVLNKVTAQSWINSLAGQMERQATVVGGGSLRKSVLSDKAAKNQRNLKKRKIDIEEHAAKYEKYKERQHKLGKKLIADKKEIDLIRKNAQRARSAAVKAQNDAFKAEKRAAAADKRASAATSLNKDLARMSWQFFKDANARNNLNNDQLKQGFAKKMGLTTKQIGDLLDE